MKTTRLFSFLILISLVSNANAQLRVLSNGRVQAGLLKDNNEDLGNVTSMQIYGRIGDARAGSKLTFGDFGQYANQGWNVFAGEYGNHGYGSTLVAWEIGYLYDYKWLC